MGPAKAQHGSGEALRVIRSIARHDDARSFFERDPAIIQSLEQLFGAVLPEIEEAFLKLGVGVKNLDSPVLLTAAFVDESHRFYFFDSAFKERERKIHLCILSY